MNRAIGLALLLFCAGCASDASRIDPAHPEGTFPVHYEMRTALADTPAFDIGPRTEASEPSQAGVRVTVHLAWIDDQVSRRLFGPSDTGLMAQALSPEEGLRLIEALDAEPLPAATARFGERAVVRWVGSDDDYLVGYDIDIDGAEVMQKCLMGKAPSGEAVEVVSHQVQPGRLDVDVAFDLVAANNAFVCPDAPDRVTHCMDVPIVVGQRASARGTLSDGGTLVLGGFRLTAPLRLRGSDWVSQSLDTTLLAFVTVATEAPTAPMSR